MRTTPMEMDRLNIFTTARDEDDARYRRRLGYLKGKHGVVRRLHRR